MGVVNKFEMTSMCMFAAPIYSLCGFNYSFLSDNDLVMEHGLGFEALKIFDQMANAGVKPDKVTFVCSSCLQPLRSSRSHKLFNQMTREFQIKPQLRNYSSMADLFGRDGLLEEARWILKSMPTEPSWPYVQTRVDSLRTA